MSDGLSRRRMLGGGATLAVAGVLDELPSSCERTWTLDADHSPFFSRPRALVRVLDAIAGA